MSEEDGYHSSTRPETFLSSLSFFSPLFLLPSSLLGRREYDRLPGLCLLSLPPLPSPPFSPPFSLSPVLFLPSFLRKICDNVAEGEARRVVRPSFFFFFFFFFFLLFLYLFLKGRKVSTDTRRTTHPKPLVPFPLFSFLLLFAIPLQKEKWTRGRR